MMRVPRPVTAVALASLSFAAPATEAGGHASKVERGAFSRDAVFACSPPQFMKPLRIPSPDGQKTIVVTSDHDKDLPHSILTVEAFGKKFQADFTWSPDCEVLWSPDSRAFFATYTLGGAVGGFVAQIFFVRPGGLELVDPTEALVTEFMSRPHYCYLDEGPNVGSVTWLGDSSRLLVAAEFLPHSNCEEMGTFRAYEITIPEGKILKEYDQLSAKRLFWRHLGDELRNADDECPRKPKRCDAEAVKLGRERFTD